MMSLTFKHTVYQTFSSKERVSFNVMAAVTTCSDFGAKENKVCHCFHCFPIYLPWNDGTECHGLSFLNVISFCFFTSLLNFLLSFFFFFFRFFYVLVFWPQGMWDLSFLTRDWTQSLCPGRRRSLNYWTIREIPVLSQLFPLSFFTFIKRLFSSSSLSAIKMVSSAYLRLLIFLPAILIPAFFLVIHLS